MILFNFVYMCVNYYYIFEEKCFLIYMDSESIGIKLPPFLHKNKLPP